MEVFFYGLFMAKELLLGKGVNPTNERMAHINNYTLNIGHRASLMPCLNKVAYGILMTIPDVEVINLYKEKSVTDYIPEQVEVITETNKSLMATCYNLPPELMTGTNEAYAKALFSLAKRLNFPKDYLDMISKIIYNG